MRQNDDAKLGTRIWGRFLWQDPVVLDLHGKSQTDHKIDLAWDERDFLSLIFGPLSVSEKELHEPLWGAGSQVVPSHLLCPIATCAQDGQEDTYQRPGGCAGSLPFKFCCLHVRTADWISNLIDNIIISSTFWLIFVNFRQPSKPLVFWRTLAQSRRRSTEFMLEAQHLYPRHFPNSSMSSMCFWFNSWCLKSPATQDLNPFTSYFAACCCGSIVSMSDAEGRTLQVPLAWLVCRDERGLQRRWQNRKRKRWDTAGIRLSGLVCPSG